MEVFTLIVLIIGVILMTLEIILPGGISFCVGLSSILIGLAYQFGLLREPINIFFIWSLLSLVLSTIGFYILKKVNEGAEIKEFIKDDAADAFGEEAVVVEEVGQQKGRVQFRGTGWSAITLGEKINTGQTVKIVSRDNLTWIVEPV